jgi:hypothetical protein
MRKKRRRKLIMLRIGGLRMFGDPEGLHLGGADRGGDEIHEFCLRPNGEPLRGGPGKKAFTRRW